MEAHDILIQDNELLETVLNNTASSIMLLKPVRQQDQVVDFQYIFTNTQSLNSVKRNELRGRLFTQEFPGLAGSALLQSYIQVIETGKSFQEEVDITPFGVPIWAQIYASRTGGNLLVTYFDITERKRAELERQKAEKQLSENRDLLQKIMDAPNVGISIFRAVRDEGGEVRNFRFEFINKRTLEAFRGNDPTGSLLTDYGSDGVEQLDHFRDALLSRRTNSYSRKAQSGIVTGWFLFSNAPLDDDRVVQLWEDITEIKNAEQQIIGLQAEIAKKATDKYYSLFNSIREGFCIMEGIQGEDDSIVDMIFTETNPAFEQITGLGDITGKKLSESMPDLQRSWSQNFEQARRTGEVVHAENYMKDKERWYSTQHFRIGDANSRVVTVAFNDITEQKNRERLRDYQLKLRSTLQVLVLEHEIVSATETVLGNYLEGPVRISPAPNAGQNPPVRQYNFGPGPWSRAEQAVIGETEKTMIEALTRAASDAALREREERFRTYVNASFEVVYMMSPDWKIMLQLDGKGFVKNASNIENWIDEYIPPHEKDRVESAIEKSIREKNVFALEHQVIDAGGNISWTYSRAVPRLNEQNEIIEWIGAATDITRRKLTENALKESEEKFRTLFETIDEGFCIIEVQYDTYGQPHDYRFLEVNPAFSEHTGLYNVTGRTIREFAPLHEQFWFDIFSKVATSGAPERFEYFASQISSGTWFDLYAFRIGDPGEQRVAVLFNNINDRKRKERQQGFLLQFSDTLRLEPDADVVGNLALKMLSEQLQLDRCFICTFNLTNDYVRFTHQTGNEKIPPLSEDVRLSDFPGTLRTALTGTFAIRDVEKRRDLSTEERSMLHAMGLRAFVAVTLKEGPDKPIWSLVAVSAVPRLWTSDEVALIEEVTEKTWTSMDRAKREKTLLEMNETLEHKVRERTRQLSALKVEQEKERLNAILFGQEEERMRIGEGLHNGVAQLLFAVQSKLQLVQPSEEKQRQALNSTMTILAEAIRDTRNIAFEIMPPVLKDYGLEVAIHSFLQKIISGDLHMRIDIPPGLRFSENREISIYRIVQELLSNIVKHSHAGNGLISIRVTRKYIHVLAEDDGTGFDVRKIRSSAKGIGLRNIDNRIKLLDGKLTIRCGPGSGTRVEIKLPIEPENKI